MIKRVNAFAPANISCIFQIYEHKDPRWAGSLGIGFTLDRGVVVTVEQAEKTEIFFNNKKIDFPTVMYVINYLLDSHVKFGRLKNNRNSVKISISSPLPLGYGFGLSGASALATAYAINKFFVLEKSLRNLAILAHTAEVINKTGLGDVTNQYFGGFLLKTKPSSYFLVKKLPIDNTNVYCDYFSDIATRKIVSDSQIKKNINIAAEKAIGILKKNKTISFAEVITLSKKFAQASGLLRDEKTSETIQKIEDNGGHASMIMLGNAVFSDVLFRNAKKFQISEKGAYVL